MSTSSATLVRPTGDEAVTTVERLLAEGSTYAELRAQLAAGRWRRFGKAVVRHNGPVSAAQRHAIVLVNAGPRSMLTSFTALEELGLQGWHRDTLHVVVPAGARVRRLPQFPTAVHAVVEWPPPSVTRRVPVHAAAPSAVLAASGASRSRLGIALLAACAQQQLVTAGALEALVRPAGNLRHRAALLAAIGDIGMGAEALSEIDFARLCRRARLAEPVRQAVRVEPSGRRRYLDAEWRLPDGRRLVAEVDGALHLAPQRWWDDQLRQNELAIARSVVLRFPAPIVREGDPVIVDQLRRAGVPPAR